MKDAESKNKLKLNKTQIAMLEAIPTDTSSDGAFINKILLAVYNKDGLKGSSVGAAYEKIKQSKELRKIRGEWKQCAQKPGNYHIVADGFKYTLIVAHAM